MPPVKKAKKTVKSEVQKTLFRFDREPVHIEIDASDIQFNASIWSRAIAIVHIIDKTRKRSAAAKIAVEFKAYSPEAGPQLNIYKEMSHLPFFEDGYSKEIELDWKPDK